MSALTNASHLPAQLGQVASLLTRTTEFVLSFEENITTIQETLQKKLEERSAKIVVLGLGYVGLPLAVVFAEAGFTVVGVDPDERKVNAITKGESYIISQFADDTT